ncbi:unnamed protein product [Vitrella brassicaformis CCMP3155]|uniref:RING-CH-type domain-containing protein n=2 Tax=Vitrella brassicaformis TaxID=1169539 RepID=A0A0G4E851_VITBC|nr:unnamed protein product [Vitrella brassicaformis CCMP3155]|eukprot:CEL91624.1 unnamed protein product [Vitrella brassicaformis CCMP3155]
MPQQQQQQQQQQREMPTLKVTTTTWARDSHDLFDYEARHVNTKTFYIQRPMKAFRSGTDIQLIPEGVANPTNADYLVRFVSDKNGKFQVVPAERSGSQSTNPKKLWLIVKDLQPTGHIIQENDVIKLGRFKLRVRQCVKSGDVQPELRLDDSDVPDVGGAPGDDLKQMQCRICLLEGPNEDDPLVAPCECKGSIKFVHINCLRHWIKGRLQNNGQSDNSGSTFFYKQQQCELCKTAFPPAGMANGEKLQIVQVPNTQPPFIVLENLVSPSQQQQNRGLHVISMAEKKILKLGRGHESDVRIADVSISRYHATIRFVNDNFVLEDHNSKFGTLVAIRKSHVVDVDSPVSVQVGRSAISLSIEENPGDVPIEGSDAPAPGGNNNPGSGSGGGGGNGGGGQTDGNPDASMEGGDGSHPPSQANDGSSGGGGQGGGGGGPAAASDSDHAMMGVEHSDASAANAYLALAPHMIPSITAHDKTTALPPSVMMPYSPQLPTAHTQPYSPPMRPGLPSALWGRLGSGPLAYTPTPPAPATNATVVPQSKPAYFPSAGTDGPPAMVAPTPTQSIPQQPQQHGGPGGIAGVTVGVGMAGMVQPVPHPTPHQQQQHAAFAAAGGAAGPPHGGHGPLGSLLTFFSPQARNA